MYYIRVKDEIILFLLYYNIIIIIIIIIIIKCLGHMGKDGS